MYNIQNQVFAAICIVLLFYYLIVLFNENARDKYSKHSILIYIPSLFTTLGLLGTFVGIAIGLSRFSTEPDEIRSSITTLIGGLKGALGTSIIGIILSIITSILLKLKIGMGHISPPLSDEYIALKLINRSIDDKLSQVNNTIIGFKEEMSANQQEAILNALEVTVEKFNDVMLKSIEGLVDGNFDKLTGAIDQLIAWQKYYRSDIIEIRDSYQSLVANHTEFVEKANEWLDIMEEVAGQTSKLKYIVNQFNEAFNEDGNLSLTIENMKDSSKVLLETSQGLSELIIKMENAAESYQETGNKVDVWTNKVVEVSDSAIDIVSTLELLKNTEVSDINELSSMFNEKLAKAFMTMDRLMKVYIESLEKKMKNVR